MHSRASSLIFFSICIIYARRQRKREREGARCGRVPELCHTLELIKARGNSVSVRSSLRAALSISLSHFSDIESVQAGEREGGGERERERENKRTRTGRGSITKPQSEYKFSVINLCLALNARGRTITLEVIGGRWMHGIASTLFRFLPRLTSARGHLLL